MRGFSLVFVFFALPAVFSPARADIVAHWPLDESGEDIIGGFDGLDIIRRLLCQSVEKLAPHGAILLEIDHDQSEAIRQFGSELFHGAKIHIEKDFEGRDRIFLLER